MNRTTTVFRTAKHLAETYADETIVFVGHGSTVQSAYLGFDGNAKHTLVPYCSITKVTGTPGKWTVETLAETSHVADLLEKVIK